MQKLIWKMKWWKIRYLNKENREIQPKNCVSQKEYRTKIEWKEWTQIIIVKQKHPWFL